MSGWGSIYSGTVSAMRQHSAILARLQSQASTGSRLLRISDDPSDASRILHLREQSLTLEGYSRNLDYVVTTLEQVSSSLQEISPVLSRIRELLTQAASATYSAANRTAMGEEIEALLEQIVSAVNFKSLGRYIFGGADMSSAPYSVERAAGTITAVTYGGSADNLAVPVAPGVTSSGLVVGDHIFRSRTPWWPAFLGNTGAQAGTGASTVEGQLTLQATHLATTYNDTAGTGILPGTSTADDTILGTSHTVTIDADNNKIRLDDGVEQDYAAEVDLELTNSAGDTVYVDVSNLTLPAGTETVSITATARLSIDGGTTTTLVTGFGMDETVVDSATGRVLSVDASGLMRVGDEPVRVAADSYDLFGTVISLCDLMTNRHDLPEDQQLDLLSEAVGWLDGAMAGLSQHMTAVGGRLQAMDNLGGSLEGLRGNTDTETASLADADIIEVATELARTQTLYEMTLATAGRLLNLSLLDFI